MTKLFNNKKLLILLLLAFIVRAVSNNIEYSPDALSSTIWAKFLTHNSISDLYKYLPNGYLPYPPLYYYILLPIGYFISIIGLSFDSWLALFLVKLPVIFSDLLLGLGIYSITTKWNRGTEGLAAAGFYLLNPVVVYNTSVWGQIDSVIILIGSICVDSFAQQKIFKGWLWFVIGSLIKLQMMVLLPLAIILTIKRKTVKLFIKYCFILILIALVPFLPLLAKGEIVSTISYFVNLPNQYPYTSVYAYNIWAPLGFLISDKLILLGIVEIRVVGILLFWFISIWILLPFLKKNRFSESKLFFAAFLLWFAFALFPTRIHSRYLIYTFGFIAPFVGQLPKFSVSLTLLMIANFLLPNKSVHFSLLVKLLNTQMLVICVVVFALTLFFYGYKHYTAMKA